jgi:formate dehydrogenase iron-sulfur subunit
MSSLKMYIPLDAAARAVGADQTAARGGRRGIAPQNRRPDRAQRLARMLWLEPLVEVEIAGRRHRLWAR